MNILMLLQAQIMFKVSIMCKARVKSGKKYNFLSILAELRWPEGPQAEPHNYRKRITCIHRNQCNSFLMVKKASGMDHGHVRPTMTTTTSRNIAAILLTASHAVLDYSIYLILDIHIMFN